LTAFAADLFEAILSGSARPPFTLALNARFNQGVSNPPEDNLA
jgi:hypothetical protein